MVGQLTDHAELMSNPRVRLGILPLDAEYRCPAINFVIYDRKQVLTETVSAELTIMRRSEILLHEKTFGILGEQAVYGDRARALLDALIDRRRNAQ
ncbi:Scr1 family TA system antitoxin-like transcriptional regulator [Nocardia sp. CA-151230]|uniref:Scr1 family TA system antitoxin-like transcriptional regulator n=1 Tax=Nocardia sp. CA-151230 TaxID=3239982 RepID=UPI003D944C68